jgi:hypothetical protein
MPFSASQLGGNADEPPTPFMKLVVSPQRAQVHSVAVNFRPTSTLSERSREA